MPRRSSRGSACRRSSCCRTNIWRATSPPRPRSRSSPGRAIARCMSASRCKIFARCARAIPGSPCWCGEGWVCEMVMRLLIEPIVRAALLEDLGRAGDITTDAVVPADAEVAAIITARQPGVLAGLEAGLLAFELLDPTLRLEVLCK